MGVTASTTTYSPTISTTTKLSTASTTTYSPKLSTTTTDSKFTSDYPPAISTTSTNPSRNWWLNTRTDGTIPGIPTATIPTKLSAGSTKPYPASTMG